ncbi:Pumilio y domain member 6 [Mycoemilia scoparia]|uniref:Pumilio y domain member 6 n=1 Tax=Mycoemilia scoparia TaxID=417184 RepID=A0A9W8DNS2_9FUNG|nr:Pumilio y domain member 6 [Mycoemilia scoparia]
MVKTRVKSTTENFVADKKRKSQDNRADSEDSEAEYSNEEELQAKNFKKAKNNNQGSKEAQIQKKKLKNERKAAKPKGDIIAQAKKIWEQLRRRDLESGKRAEVMGEMMNLIGGSIKEVTFKHDASRIIQTCMKYGSQEERDRIAEELRGSYIELSKSLYGRYILVRMLKYCSKYRDQIIESFYGNVRKLIRHKEAAMVIEECYSMYAKAYQRAALVQEFYGPEFAIFKNNTRGSNQKNPKKGDDARYYGLDVILSDAPQKKENILSNLKQTLLPLIAKGTIHHSIVHKALLDYFTYANEKECFDMVEEIKEFVVEILHTKDGAHVGMYCFLYATPKVRKSILKSFKPFLEKICTEEYGHAVLLQAFDVMDDTVFVEKAIISELIPMIPDLLSNIVGRRSILYIVIGRHNKYIAKQVISHLNDLDGIRAKTSKKDPGLRRQELSVAISPGLLKWVESNITEILNDPILCQAATDIIVFAHGDKTAVLNALCEVIKEANSVEDLDDHPMLGVSSNRLLSTLVKADTALPKLPDSSVKVPESNPVFSTKILQAVDPEVLKNLAVKGSFPVLTLVECKHTSEKVKKILLPNIKEIEKAAKVAQRSKTVYAGILKALI